MAEHLANFAQTTLATAIGAPAAGTSEVIQVASVARFPTEPVFRLNLGGGELAKVTHVEGLKWTVERGTEGTTPIAHPAGQVVTCVQTVGSLQALIEQATQALDPKESVQLATAAALPGNTYANGVLTAAGNGALTIDGTAVGIGQRVLVKNEAAQSHNGLYTVTSAGSAGAPYVLTRTADMSANGQVKGAFVFVEAGATNEGAGFTVVSIGPFTIGTTAIVWTQFSGLGEITAGAGLEKTGSTLNAIPEETRAKAAEATLTANLAAEAATRAAAVTAAIATAEAASDAAGTAAAGVAVERARAEGAEGTNTTAISTERGRAEVAEGLKLAKASNLADVASAATARTNLGLGTAATHPATDFDTAGVAATEQARAEAAEALKIPLTQRGAASGVGTLDAEGHQPTGQLSPSAVSNSTAIDLVRQYGATPGEDITAKVAEALATAVVAGYNTITLYCSKPGVYLIEGTVQEGEAFGYKYAGQILLPARTGAQGRLTVTFAGTTPAPKPLFVGESEPSTKVPGVVWKTTATTGYVVDVIPAYESYLANQPFSNVFARAENMTLQLPNNPQCGGFNFGCARWAETRGFVTEVASTTEGAPTYPTGTRAALTLPHVANDGRARTPDTYICGCPVGVAVSEHANLDGLMIQRCAVALDALAGGATLNNAFHMIQFGTVSVEKCSTVLRAQNSGVGGGVILGTLDVEMNSLTGEWAHTENLIEDVGSRLHGHIAICNRQQPSKGFQGKYGGKPTLNISNPEQGNVGCRSSYPVDNFVRSQDIAGQIGACQPSCHPWTNPEGEATTVTAGETAGALRAIKSTGITLALVPFVRRIASGSRIITATIKTRAAGKYTVAVVMGCVFEGTNKGNFLFVNLFEGKVELKKNIKGTITKLAEGGAVANNTSYEVTVLVTHPTVFGAPESITVYVGTTEVFKYSLTAEDKTALIDGNLLEQQDGIRIVEDNESTVTRFQVVPV